MVKMKSQKFKFLDDNIQKILAPLLRNQTFLRMVYNLNSYPLEKQYYKDSTLVLQPDIITPYQNMMSDGHMVLTLFNQSVLSEQKVMIFLSHLRSPFTDGLSITSESTYAITIVVPYIYVALPITHEQRQHIIAREICNELDGQKITGIGNIYCTLGSEAKINDTYQAFDILLKVTNSNVHS
jgi:hypothetical protein